MFVKYPSITNHYYNKFLNRIREDIRTKQNWFTTEKIHGANFSILYDGKKFEYAGKNGIYDEDRKFYNYRNDLAFVLPKIENLFLDIKQDNKIKRCKQNDDNFSIQVYGEYCGPKIQKGVQYGKRDFIVFDIKINDTFFIDFDYLLELCNYYSINTVPILCTGDFDTCLAYPNDENSKILDIADNMYEGTVIRPNKSIYFGTTRIIIKNKNAKFSEKIKIKKPKVAHVFTEEQLNFLQYINENRVNCVLSANPELGKNFGKLLGAVIVDALEECPTKMDKYITKYIGNVIRPVFLSNLENLE